MQRRGSAESRDLRTVLFTDIVGSTETATRLGDRAWGDLLARHHAVVRAALRSHAGHEEDTAGDGFFATFSRPTDALVCAGDIVHGVAALGLAVRVGLQAGEVELGDGKAAGITVHTAARLMAAAAPGEVLVSATVRELTAGAGWSLADRGQLELKGLAEPVHTYALDLDVVPDQSRRVAVARQGRAGSSRFVLAFVGAAVAIIVILAGAQLAGGLGSHPNPTEFPSVAGASPSAAVSQPSGASVVVEPHSVAVLDTATNIIVADLPSLGSNPMTIASGDGSIWVGDGDDHTIIRIDATSREILRTTGLEGVPVGLSAGSGYVWITIGFSGQLSRIAVASNQNSGPIFPTDPPVAGLMATASGPGDLWTGLADDQLLRLDSENLQPFWSVRMPVRVFAIALDGKVGWTIGWQGNLVRRVDPTSGAASPGLPVSGSPKGIAFGAGSIWVVTVNPNLLWQIDPNSDQVGPSYPVSILPSAVVAGSDAIWVLDTQGKIERFDPTGRVLPATYSIGQMAGGMALAGGDLWITIP